MGAQRRVGAQGGAVLCQEFLVGPEYVVDTVTSAGEHKVTAVWMPLPSPKSASSTDPEADWLWLESGVRTPRDVAAPCQV